MKSFKRLMIIMGLGLLAIGLMGMTPVSGIILDNPPLLSAQPQPGLATLYYKNDKKVRHIDKMIDDAKFMRRGKKGAYLPNLDHDFNTGNVFDSGRMSFVGMLITGLLHFDQEGQYELKALSNDGVRVFAQDTVLLEDPDIHGDRFSPVGQIMVKTPGWYPIKIKYFQRKGTAALKMYWKKPGQSDFSIIPAAAWGHPAE